VSAWIASADAIVTGSPLRVVQYLDDRDPGDEDRRPVGVTPYRASQIADELDALEDSGSNEATQALIRKLMEGKLK
jgi:hypothetical protein